MATPSAACCKRSPVTVDYKTQGRYETLAGVKTYITGPENATRAIITIYDAFGMWNQTLQGADLLSSLTGALVLVPDFFHGGGAKHEWFPLDTPERKEVFFAWYGTQADFAKNLAVLLDIRKALATRSPAVDDHVGVFGLCWGGKVSTLAALGGNEGAGRRFTVSGSTHPAGLDVEDAKQLTAPYILLASKEEDAEVVAAFQEVFATQPDKTGEVETYATMHHGWMGARAKLDDPENVKEYTRGYEQAAAFFDKYL